MCAKGQGRYYGAYGFGVAKNQNTSGETENGETENGNADTSNQVTAMVGKHR